MTGRTKLNGGRISVESDADRREFQSASIILPSNFCARSIRFIARLRVSDLPLATLSCSTCRGRLTAIFCGKRGFWFRMIFERISKICMGINHYKMEEGRYRLCRTDLDQISSVVCVSICITAYSLKLNEIRSPRMSSQSRSGHQQNNRPRTKSSVCQSFPYVPIGRVLWYEVFAVRASQIQKKYTDQFRLCL
jgi:hypothetical protein